MEMHAQETLQEKRWQVEFKFWPKVTLKLFV